MYNPAEFFTIAVFIPVYKKQDGCYTYNQEWKYTDKNYSTMYLVTYTKLPIGSETKFIKSCTNTDVQ